MVPANREVDICALPEQMLAKKEMLVLIAWATPRIKKTYMVSDTITNP